MSNVINGFIFHTDKCVGCHACVVACSVENDLEPGSMWREITPVNKPKVSFVQDRVRSEPEIFPAPVSPGTIHSAIEHAPKPVRKVSLKTE